MQAEQQLKASLKEIGDLKAALDEHAIVAITDPQGKITYVNDKFCAISKYSREELLGQDHRIINSGFHSKEFIQKLWHTITHGKVWKGEIKNKAKDGSFYWVDTTIVPFLNEHGKPRQYVAIRADITERKRAEERALWLGSFPELNPNPIIELDLSTGIIHYANPCARKVFPDLQQLGLNHPALTGLTTNAQVCQATTTTPVRREIGVGDEYYSQTITYVPESQRLRVYGTNITERKHAEDQLKASLKEIGDLKAALDEHAIVAITDPQGKITYVNDKFCAISKYSREELLGQDHRIINSGFHPKEFIQELWHTITHGKVWKGEIKNKAKDGSFYWVDTTIVPFLDEHGKPRQYVAIRADITERKRAEEQLKASLKEVRNLTTALDEHAIVAITDPQGKITYVNDKFCAISKYSREELLGQDHRIINSGYHSKEFIRNLWTTITQGRVWHGEIKNKTKDNLFYWVDTTIVPFLNEAGKPRQYVAIRADITERKRAEAEILQLNTELEHRVTKRTSELEAANKELEAFSYSISHDLRAPLRAVSGFAGIVLQDFGAQLPEEGRRYLQRVCNGGQRMGELIDDLLAFARLNRQPMNRRQVNTARIVQEVLTDLNPQENNRPIEIRVNELRPCQGDPALLKQVWVNLLSNAVKYTRGREPAIVEIGSESNNGEIVYFVRDNGVGFDMQYANKLFGVFQRLHRADEFEGTGVGLAIVQRIIHRHSGRVWVDAALDRGATFYFTLEGENNDGKGN